MYSFDWNWKCFAKGKLCIFLGYQVFYQCRVNLCFQFLCAFMNVSLLPIFNFVFLILKRYWLFLSYLWVFKRNRKVQEVFRKDSDFSSPIHFVQVYFIQSILLWFPKPVRCLLFGVAWIHVDKTISFEMAEQFYEYVPNHYSAYGKTRTKPFLLESCPIIQM